MVLITAIERTLTYLCAWPLTWTCPVGLPDTRHFQIQHVLVRMWHHRTMEPPGSYCFQEHQGLNSTSPGFWMAFIPTISQYPLICFRIFTVLCNHAALNINAHMRSAHPFSIFGSQPGPEAQHSLLSSSDLSVRPEIQRLGVFYSRPAPSDSWLSAQSPLHGCSSDTSHKWDASRHLWRLPHPCWALLALFDASGPPLVSWS